MRMAKALLGCAALLFTVSVAAEPAKPPLSPLAAVQAFRGSVEIRTTGQTVLVTLRGEDGDHAFKVETDLLAGLPGPFHTGDAEILFWRGHLVVTASREGKAWHFSVPGADALRRPEDPRLPGRELDARLQAAYELTRIDRASAILSRSGPAALTPGPEERLKGIFASDTEYQDPGGGGIGSCGKTCNITCGDGSSCSASCSESRCASCSCPASCSCK
ncbi:MAG: hypothetical protein ABUT39_13645 [Acidobacteriota bacterium]